MILSSLPKEVVIIDSLLEIGLNHPVSAALKKSFRPSINLPTLLYPLTFTPGYFQNTMAIILVK
jgi:hypothetical protein